jgi:hypothetical protein
MGYTLIGILLLREFLKLRAKKALSPSGGERM